MKRYILALDQGTTSSRAILFDNEQNIVGLAQKEFTQFYPKPGYVEHDPLEIYSSQYAVLMEVLLQCAVDPDEVAAIGITNQRETTIVWDRHTGRPVHNAIVWQCRRTAELCEELKQEGLEPHIKQTTGLLADAYFSATKIRWILDHVPDAQQKAEAGDLLFGTVDSWLVWKMTDGKVHATDYTNAARTMLFDIHSLQWDKTLLSRLNIPACMLPEVRPSSGHFGFVNLSGHEVPITGIAGDQQAALFGQTCFNRGDVKNTYGTGCFLLMNTGNTPCVSSNGLLTTLTAGTTNAQAQYAVEGSVFVGGAAVQWLRDEMRLITEAGDSEYFARKTEDNGGVYFVPAFTGLGAPHWNMYARGSIFGLTRGTGRNHIIRAALESIAYQTKDVLDAAAKDTGCPVHELRVDGGASANAFLMQFQADILGMPVRRPIIRETTALGAAYLAGLAAGVWNNTDEIKQQWTLDKLFNPSMPEEQRQQNLGGWRKAIGGTLHWAE